jgi:transposase
MPVGDDTLLSLVRQTPLPERPTPQVVGVDDWALRKGQTYATILVDLQTGQPIDLLSGRSAEQFAQWLKDHPGVTVISRDRGGIYAAGATSGAPDAIQVADRWHILKNLGEALLQVLQQQHQALNQAFTTADPLPSTPPEMLPPEGADASAPSEPLLAEPFVALTHREQEQQARHAAKLARQAQVQQLHAQGWSLHAIAAHTRLERKTVRKYLHIAQLPPAQARGQRRSLLDPYKPYILERWQAGCSNVMQLLREIQTQGYRGQRSILREYLTCLRKRQGLPPRSRSGGTNSSVVPPRKPPTLQTLTWLIIRQADTLSAEEAADVAQAREAHPDVDLATNLAQDFAALVRNRQPDDFDAWLDRAASSNTFQIRTYSR